MKIAIIGAGGHASDVLGVIENLYGNMGSTSDIQVGVVADSSPDKDRFSQRGVDYWGGIDGLGQSSVTHYVLGVGYSVGRYNVYQKVKHFGLHPLALINDRAFIPDGVPVGDGTVILAGVCVSPLAIIGSHVYISHGSLVGHDCEIQDFVSIMPGASISGDTILEEQCLIGANATVIQGVKVGKGAIIGAGAVVTKDVPPGVTVIGNPGRFMAKPEKS